MRLFRLVAAVAVALTASLLPACGQGSGKVKVAFVTNNPHSFWNIAEAGCRQAESETGVEVVFKRPETGDAARQKEIIDQLLQQGVKAIAISVIEPEQQRAYLDEVANKVKLITQDNDAPKTARIAYIGTNNYKAGRAVGRLVKEVMPSGGTIAIFVGQTEALNARQRREGVLDELAGKPEPADIAQIDYSPDGKTYGQYKLFVTRTDQTDSQKAKEVVTDTIAQLQGEKNLCFIGLWAYNPPAILSAVKDANMLGQIKIVGFDEEDATLDGIRDGHIYATVVQNPYQFGYQAVTLMAKLVQQGDAAKPANPLNYIPERIITKDGSKGPDGSERLAVEPFRKELKEQQKPR